MCVYRHQLLYDRVIAVQMDYFHAFSLPIGRRLCVYKHTSIIQNVLFALKWPISKIFNLSLKARAKIALILLKQYNYEDFFRFSSAPTALARPMDSPACNTYIVCTMDSHEMDQCEISKFCTNVFHLIRCKNPV